MKKINKITLATIGIISIALPLSIVVSCSSNNNNSNKNEIIKPDSTQNSNKDKNNQNIILIKKSLENLSKNNFVNSKKDIATKGIYNIQSLLNNQGVTFIIPKELENIKGLTWSFELEPLSSANNSAAANIIVSTNYNNQIYSSSSIEISGFLSDNIEIIKKTLEELNPTYFNNYGTKIAKQGIYTSNSLINLQGLIFNAPKNLISIENIMLSFDLLPSAATSADVIVKVTYLGKIYNSNKIQIDGFLSQNLVELIKNSLIDLTSKNFSNSQQAIATKGTYNIESLLNNQGITFIIPKDLQNIKVITWSFELDPLSINDDNTSANIVVNINYNNQIYSSSPIQIDGFLSESIIKIIKSDLANLNSNDFKNNGTQSIKQGIYALDNLSTKQGIVFNIPKDLENIQGLTWAFYISPESNSSSNTVANITVSIIYEGITYTSSSININNFLPNNLVSSNVNKLNSLLKQITKFDFTSANGQQIIKNGSYSLEQLENIYGIKFTMPTQLADISNATWSFALKASSNSLTNSEGIIIINVEYNNVLYSSWPVTITNFETQLEFNKNLIQLNLNKIDDSSFNNAQKFPLISGSYTINSLLENQGLNFIIPSKLNELNDQLTWSFALSQYNNDANNTYGNMVVSATYQDITLFGKTIKIDGFLSNQELTNNLSVIQKVLDQLNSNDFTNKGNAQAFNTGQNPQSSLLPWLGVNFIIPKSLENISNISWFFQVTPDPNNSTQATIQEIATYYGHTISSNNVILSGFESSAEAQKNQKKIIEILEKISSSDFIVPKNRPIFLTKVGSIEAMEKTFGIMFNIPNQLGNLMWIFSIAPQSNSITNTSAIISFQVYSTITPTNPSDQPFSFSSQNIILNGFESPEQYYQNILNKVSAFSFINNGQFVAKNGSYSQDQLLSEQGLSFLVPDVLKDLKGQWSFEVNPFSEEATNNSAYITINFVYENTTFTTKVLIDGFSTQVDSNLELISQIMQSINNTNPFSANGDYVVDNNSYSQLELISKQGVTFTIPKQLESIQNLHWSFLVVAASNINTNNSAYITISLVYQGQLFSSVPFLVTGFLTPQQKAINNNKILIKEKIAQISSDNFINNGKFIVLSNIYSIDSLLNLQGLKFIIPQELSNINGIDSSFEISNPFSDQASILVKATYEGKTFSSSIIILSGFQTQNELSQIINEINNNTNILNTNNSSIAVNSIKVSEISNYIKGLPKLANDFKYSYQLINVNPVLGQISIVITVTNAQNKSLSTKSLVFDGFEKQPIIVDSVQLQKYLQNTISYAPFAVSKDNTNISAVFNLVGQNVTYLTSYDVLKTDYINGTIEIELFGQGNYSKIFNINGFIKNPNANFLNDYKYETTSNNAIIIGLKNPSLVNLSFANYYLTSSNSYIPITEIGPSAFAFGNIATVNFTSLITTIGSAAFSSNNIESMIIPFNITNIEEKAFINNPFAQQQDHILYIENPNCQWVQSVNTTSFSNNYGTGIQYVEVGKTELYEWSTIHGAYEKVIIGAIIPEENNN